MKGGPVRGRCLNLRYVWLVAERYAIRIVCVSMDSNICQQAVILAAGQGTRLRPLTLTRPKPLVEVAGKPLLEHTFAVLPDHITDVVIVVGYLGEQIREHIGYSYYGKRVSYAEQGPLQSTGGALVSALDYLEDRFMVLNADDLHGREAIHRMFAHDLALLATTSDTPEKFGALEVHSDGTLRAIEEKPEAPKTNLVNTGIMLLDRRIFTYDVPQVGDELRLTDMVVALAQDVPVHVETQDRFCAVGYPEDIPVAEQMLTLWQKNPTNK